MGGRRARRRKKRQRRRRAMGVGLGAIGLQLALALLVPWLWFPDDVERHGPLMLIGSLATLLLSSWFLYFGASRLYAPELPVTIQQFRHGYTASGDAVQMHDGVAFRTSSRRRSAISLIIGVGVWLFLLVGVGRTMTTDDSAARHEPARQARPLPHGASD